MSNNVYFHWNMDPTFLKLGSLTINWYGILFAIAFLVGSWIMNAIYKKEGKDANSLDSLFVYMLFGTIVGARLGHCIFYDPHYYATHPLAIVKIWEGGLASHGGAIGILVSILFYTREPGRPSYFWMLDRLSIPTALGGSFIRIGNFFNSEIIGIPTSVPWAVVFERIDTLPRHAVQLYESMVYGVIFFILVAIYRLTTNYSRQGVLFGAFLILVFSSRFCLEFVKTSQAAYESGFLLTVGQWLSIPFIVLGIVLAVHKRKVFPPHS